jgi:hypothetical protein
MTLRRIQRVSIMTAKVCPFCGIATDVPHETQEGCIAALHGEIARMRQVLDHVRPLDHVRAGVAMRREPAEDRNSA